MLEFVPFPWSRHDFYTHVPLTTDARDKIYGIHGLCEEPEAAIGLPDYSQARSLRSLLSRAAVAMIDETVDLGVFQLVAGRSRVPQLPSWVPDLAWNDPVFDEGIRFRARPRREPDGKPELTSKQYNDEAGDPRISLDAGTMTVRGLVIDSIQDAPITCSGDQSGEERLGTWHRWLKIA